MDPVHGVNVRPPAVEINSLKESGSVICTRRVRLLALKGKRHSMAISSFLGSLQSVIVLVVAPPGVGNMQIGAENQEGDSRLLVSLIFPVSV